MAPWRAPAPAIGAPAWLPQFANAGAAAPAHQYASRFLRARPIARPGAGEHARAARGPVAPRAQRLFVMLRGLLGGLFSSFFKTGSTKIYGDFEGAGWSYFFSCVAF